MDEQRHLDEVAYAGFATVDRQVDAVEAFHQEIERLRSARAQAPPALRGAHGTRHKRASAPTASRDQLPLLPPDTAANDAGGGDKK
jgi:hypothetical protein